MIDLTYFAAPNKHRENDGSNENFDIITPSGVMLPVSVTAPRLWSSMRAYNIEKKK